ncbi:MAG: deoxyribonuclease I, partial [bacterium]
MDKPGVPEALVQIADRYDLVLIQEVRDKSGAAIVELLDLLNVYTDDDFAMVISDRLGRTTSKEQYAYFYRQSKLSVIDSYHYDDGVEP